MLQNGLMQRDLLRDPPLLASITVFATLFRSAGYSSSIDEPPRFYFVSVSIPPTNPQTRDHFSRLSVLVHFCIAFRSQFDSTLVRSTGERESSLAI